VLQLRAFCRYWLPALAWMALIFTASSDTHSYEHSSRFVEPLLRWLFPHLPEAQIQAIHHLLRKVAHLTEYAVLAWLVWRGVRKPSKNHPRAWNWYDVRLALLIVMLCAATDEFHQEFVSSRTALVSDVFVDTGGGAAGLLALWLSDRWRNRSGNLPP
jgi:VanZ family protein